MKYATIVLAVVAGCAFASVPPVSNSNFVECEACRLLEPTFVGLIDKNEKVVEKDLDNVCDRFGKLVGPMCIKFVNGHIEKLVAALNKDGADPAKVCADIGACAAVDVVERVQPTNSNDFECKFCELAVPFAEKEIAGEGPQATAALDHICNDLPSIIKDECVKLVTKYMGELVNALKNGAGADTVCKDLHFCSSMEALKAEANVVMSRAARVQQSKIDPKCLLCHVLAPTLEELAGKEEPVIVKELDTICKDVLGWEHELATKCESWIDAEGAMIAKVLAEDETHGAKELCEKIGWCPASLVAAKIENSENVVECEICRALGPELEALAGKEEGVVVKDLEGICKKIPEIFREVCDSWIEKEGAKIAKILSQDQGSGAKVLCQKLGMCDSAVVEAKIDNLANVAECDLCEALGPELEKLAGKEEGVVEKDLEGLCDKFSIFRNGCINWVEKEGAMIAKVLSEDEGSSAHVLCQKLHMCKASLVKTEKNINVKCTICSLIGPGLEELAKREEPVVEKDLEHICKVVSFEKAWEKDCENYIMKEGAMIAEVLTKDSGSSAHDLCKKIGWC